jgi:hypothetical protein
MFRSLIDTPPAEYMVVYLVKRGGWRIINRMGNITTDTFRTMESANRACARLNRRTIHGA